MDNEITQVAQQPAQSPPAALDTGTILGNYRLDGLIGAGLLSEVYVGHNLVARKPCAVKVFRQEVPVGAVAYGRYVHETNLVNRIDHPNIVQVYASAKSEERVYTVMEHVEGSDLRRLMREKAPLSRRMVQPIMRGLCIGLAEIHAFGLFHGHLHPGQIIVRLANQTVHVKILDFGTRHLLPRFGDPPPGWQWRPEDAVCIAPEQTKGLEGESRSDIYALTVILYEMITGRVPFLADSFAATLEQHASEQPVPPSQLVSLPAELEETILRGLEKDPKKRIPSVEALLAALDPMAVTGQHQRRPKTTGRYQALSAKNLADPPEQLPHYLDPAESQPAASFPPPAVPEPPPVVEPLAMTATGSLVPKSRGRIWLFVLLGIVVLGCGLALTLTLIDDDEKSSPQRPVKKLRPRAPSLPRRGPRPTTRPRQPAPPAERRPRRRPRAVLPGPEPQPRKETAFKPAISRARAFSKPAIAKFQERLKPVRGFGTLEISSNSPNAQVFVNGKFRGRGHQVNLSGIAAGTHRIHLVIDGRKTPSRDVKLEPRQNLVVRF